MLVLVNVVLPAATVAATDPAVSVHVALVKARVSPVSIPADRVTDPAAPVNSPQAPVFGPFRGSLNMLLARTIEPFLIVIHSWALSTSPPRATLAPLNAIDQAVELVREGAIAEFEYDQTQAALVKVAKA